MSTDAIMGYYFYQREKKEVSQYYLFSSSKSAVTSIGSDGAGVLHAADIFFLVEGVIVWHRDRHTAWVNVPRSKREAVIPAAPDSLICVNC